MSMEQQQEQRQTVGPIAWMARHSVAANLLMLFLIVGGIAIALQTKQEIFPEFSLDYVTISIPYPGAGPEEIERGIVLAIEEEVRGVDGVKRVTAVASEGSAQVVAELLAGTNSNKALQDIKNAVDRITSFPQEAERPTVSLLSNRRAVLSLILYGDLEERYLRQLAETVRDELLQLPRITFVDIVGTRPPEISIEVPQSNLRAYNLTLDHIAKRVAMEAIEVPAGGVKTTAGEILLRTDERRDFGSEFKNISIVNREDGSEVVLSELAEVTDGFRDIDRAAYFFGKPAVRLIVYRVGSQTPISISNEVTSYLTELRKKLPETVGAAVWQDRSEIYRDRLKLLLKNLALGLVLVLIILGVFLEPVLAFWVTMGIPISFFGAFLVISFLDVSINMVSLFAFIISLGIVVDDAIVVGENIYEHRSYGKSLLRAAIDGARTVKVPVSFAILTNIAAFCPMFFVPGVMGKMFFVIPTIVVSIFAISWLESLLVLPAHLSHRPRQQSSRIGLAFHEGQERFHKGFDRFIRQVYLPFFRRCLLNRYLTIAFGLALLIATLGYLGGGHMNFSFLPKVDGDVVFATAVLPYGSPVEDTQAIADRLYREADNILQKYGGRQITRGIFTRIGSQAGGFGPGPAMASAGGSHVTSVEIYLVPIDQREIKTSEFAALWRESVRDLSGLESLVFKYNIGPSAGNPIDIELSHSSIAVLENAATDLANKLRSFAGVKDIDDGFSEGKPQLSFRVKPEAQSLGITAADLARQVRSAFYGARAFRQQRGREEIWVMVRLPEDERRSEFDVEELLVRTPQGGEIPLTEAAEVKRERAYTVIRRADGRRVVDVTADVEEEVANAEKVLSDILTEFLPKLTAKYPGLRFGFEGQQRDRREGLSSLWVGFGLAMMVIFAMLAIPFGSYLQPLVVMTAIPFGIIGAVFGHMLMGYELSVVSMMGIVALAGVVVNDSLVLVFYANELRLDGMSPYQAVTKAGVRRFRPILLTSLTTFFGLAPMIFETSVSARFLIPMAISLGFGVLFATVIALILVPSLYLIVFDIQGFFQSLKHDRPE
jgi:multidrug efflux pump subunit AcrB